LAPIEAFISSLMMVGVVTLPVEIRFFGKKVGKGLDGICNIGYIAK
jgi:hypothetical protein